MSENVFEQMRYVNRLSRKNRLRRLLWGLAWNTLFRPTPRWTMHGWRRFLLRSFGATIGPGSKVAPSCKIFAPWNLSLGRQTALAEGVDCYCVARIELGSMVTVSQRAFLCTASHEIETLRRDLVTAPIHVADHAWICAEAFVSPGTRVGEGSVIGARAVVSGEIPAWKVFATPRATAIRDREIRQPESTTT